MVGDKAAVIQAKQDIVRKIDIKELGELKEYIGVTIFKEDNRSYLLQLDVISKIEKNFKERVLVQDLKVPKTPMPQSHSIHSPRENMTKVNDEDQGYFRSGVMSWLYLVKHSRFDIANAVRELAKVMNGATESHMKDYTGLFDMFWRQEMLV
mmetsp:Transcript_12593/g.18097  ORF Transcript_12593/g.18097 Transcript_12593/m.18097 type:complete len:152 (+) Transcript_12593:992-1447(+)